MIKHKKILNTIYFCIVIATIVFMLASIFIMRSYDQPGKNLDQLSFSGEYRLKDGEWLPLGESGVTTDQSDRITLRGHFNRDIADREDLLLYVNFIEAHISVNGEEIFSFGTKKDYPPMMKSAGSIWVRAFSSEISTGDVVEITLVNKYSNNYYSAYNDFLDNMYSGDSGVLLRSLIQTGFVFGASGILFFVLGIMLLLISIIFTIKKVLLHKSVMLFAFYVILAALWLFLNGDYSKLLFTNGVVLLILDSLVMFLFSALTMSYFKSFLKNKICERIVSVCECAAYLFIAVMIAFQLTGIFDMYEIRQFFTPVAGIVTLVYVGVAVKEILSTTTFRDKFVFITAFIFAAAVVLEVINYELEIVSTGKFYAFGVLLYLLVQSWLPVTLIGEGVARARRTAEMEKTLADNRITVALSQIKPHFLYNSLTCINHLCNVSPKKASEALTRFARYLRGNLDSLSQTKLVAFETELQHVKNYLYLEKMRFEERLNIVYEINAQDFLIPALTLQPIAENAVRYGIGNKREGGTVVIRSYRDGKNVVVCVKDDGDGFDVSALPSGERSHVGIAVVRQRLDMQCKGTLRIQSVLGEGTTVEMILPQSSEEDGSGGI